MTQEKFNKIPEVDFKLSSTGITILCPRLYTPRFIPFDIAGRCDTCKSDSAEIDYLITIDGITIYCSRLFRPKFVPFDHGYELFPEYCLFRVKTKGKVFNVPHGKKTSNNDFGKEGIMNNMLNYDLGEEEKEESEKKPRKEEEQHKKPVEDMPQYL